MVYPFKYIRIYYISKEIAGDLSLHPTETCQVALLYS